MSVHTDTLKGLAEALEYAKGNITLKTTAIEVEDDDIGAKYNLLPNDVKQAIKIIIDNALKLSKI